MRRAEQKKIRLLIANEHPVIREGLGAMLAGDHRIEVVGYACSVQETMRMVGETEPDVLLIDPYAASQDGLRAMKLIRGEWPQVAIVAFTLQEQKEHMLQALAAGVCAYLTLASERDVVRHALRLAAEGQVILSPEHVKDLLASVSQATEVSAEQRDLQAGKDTGGQQAMELKLTMREHEVLHAVARGERNKEIAARLSISEPTVKSHLANIYFKLNVDSRASAVATAIKRGMLSLHEHIPGLHTKQGA